MKTTTKLLLGGAALAALYFVTKSNTGGGASLAPGNGNVPLPSVLSDLPPVTALMQNNNVPGNFSDNAFLPNQGLNLDAIGRRRNGLVPVSPHERHFPDSKKFGVWVNPYERRYPNVSGIGASWFCQAHPNDPSCNPTLASWYCQQHPTAPACNPTQKGIHTIILPVLKNGSKLNGVRNTFDLQRSLAL